MTESWVRPENEASISPSARILNIQSGKLTMHLQFETKKMCTKCVLLMGAPPPSLVPRPHPAHVRRRGLVSQVQILGLAPEAWSGQSNPQSRVYWNNAEARTSTSIYCSKRVMRFIIRHWSICNSTPMISRLQHFPQAQGFRLVTPDSFLMKGTTCLATS